MRDSDSQWVILSGGERVRSERFILTGGEGVREPMVHIIRK